MSRTIVALGLAAIVAAAPPALATYCALDAGPAATLLLPHFAVDLGRPAGATTLLAVENRRASPTLAKLVLWTDLGVATLGFDLFLAGFDLQTLNLRDVFLQGRLPTTGPGLVEPGPHSFLPFLPPECDGHFPPPPLAAAALAALQAAHTGSPSPLFAGECGGQDLGDGVARGFVTVDVVRTCSDLLPGADGYFGPDGVAAADNALAGDFFHLDPAGSSAQGDVLVSLEAGGPAGLPPPPGPRPDGATFYGWLLGGDGSDGREPLPARWGVRFLRGGAFDGGTSIAVWRQPPAAVEPFPCGGAPPWYPLATDGLFFDEDGGLVASLDGAAAAAQPFGAVSQLVALDRAAFPALRFGWAALGFNRAGAGEPRRRSQAWLGAVLRAEGRYSAGLAGNPLDAGCATEPDCLLGIAPPLGRLCVRGVPGADGETIAAGDRPRFEVWPAGCFPSGCTLRHEAACELRQEGSHIELSPRFCLEVNASPGAACLADCGGAGNAGCGRTPAPLAAGTYTAAAGDLELDFTVPSLLPFGGLCAGDLF